MTSTAPQTSDPTPRSGRSLAQSSTSADPEPGADACVSGAEAPGSGADACASDAPGSGVAAPGPTADAPDLYAADAPGSDDASQPDVGTDDPGIWQPVSAGIVAALVGFTSTFAVVLTGLTKVGATPGQAASGLLAICLTQAAGMLVLSRRYRMPIALAWRRPVRPCWRGPARYPEAGPLRWVRSRRWGC